MDGIPCCLVQHANIFAPSHDLRHVRSGLVAAGLQRRASGRPGLCLYRIIVHRQSDLRITQGASATDITFREVDWGARPLEPAPYYGIRYTHFFPASPASGIALDFTHYKVYAKTGRTVHLDGVWNGSAVNATAPPGNHVQQFEISHGVNLVSINGIYRWSDPAFAGGKLQPYAGAGLAHYWMHSENVVNGAAHHTGYQSSGFGYQLLAGVQYQVAPRVYAFAEAKFNRANAQVGVAGGEAEARLRTLHALLGVGYAF